jgi:hypothetical protein
MKIITPVCNNPDFIRIQAQSFAKHIHEPFEFIVFNDCKQWRDYSNFGDPTIYTEIQRVCQELSIQCIDVPNRAHVRVHSPSSRHAMTMNFIFAYMKATPDEYVCIDSDMFLIDTLDLTKWRRTPATVLVQERSGIHYIWPNLFYMDMLRIPNAYQIDFSVTGDTDSGGATHTWLSACAKEDIQYIRHLPSLTWHALPRDYPDYPGLLAFLSADPRNKNGAFYCEIYDGSILHYRAGSNWDRRSPGLHATLTKSLMGLYGLVVERSDIGV